MLTLTIFYFALIIIVHKVCQSEKHNERFDLMILLRILVNNDDCVNVTCQNGGTCLDSVATYSCACAAGFTGQHCEGKWAI